MDCILHLIIPYYYYFTNNTSYDIEITPEDYEDWASFTLYAYDTYTVSSFSSPIYYSYDNASSVTENNDSDGYIVFSTSGDSSTSTSSGYAYSSSTIYDYSSYHGSYDTYYYYYFTNNTPYDIDVTPDSSDWDSFTLSAYSTQTVYSYYSTTYFYYNYSDIVYTDPSTYNYLYFEY